MLARLARPHDRQASVTWSPIDPRFYEAIGTRSSAGIAIMPESALSLAVVYRAILVLSHAIASIPLVIQKRLPNDGKARAREHPGYRLLHDAPNRWQTSFRWRMQMMAEKILHGNHYSEILPGRGGIGAIEPLDPRSTRVVDQLSDGRLLYVTRPRTVRGLGAERRLVSDEVLHIRGFSMDGFSGLPLAQVAKNAMGLAMAAERHGAMFLKQGASFGGVLQADGALTEEVRKANEEAWQRARGGPDGSGRTPLLSGGIKFQPITSTNKDAQWLEARTFQIEELLRYLGVPGVLCGYADKTSTYASAEQFFLSFVTHTVRPETANIAAELTQSVVTGNGEYYADFVLEGLLRGDIKTRYSAHQIAISSGWKTRNEVRIEEDYNRGPAALDAFLEPLNMAQAGTRDDATADDDETDTSADTSRSRAAASVPAIHPIAQRAAERIARKERHAILGTSERRGAAIRFASDAVAWRAWLADFYTAHAKDVAADLCVTASQAENYCAARRAELDAGVPSTMTEQDFLARRVAALLALLSPET